MEKKDLKDLNRINRTIESKWAESTGEKMVNMI